MAPSFFSPVKASLDLEIIDAFLPRSYADRAIRPVHLVRADRFSAEFAVVEVFGESDEAVAFRYSGDRHSHVNLRPDFQ